MRFSCLPFRLLLCAFLPFKTLTESNLLFFFSFKNRYDKDRHDPKNRLSSEKALWLNYYTL